MQKMVAAKVSKHTGNAQKDARHAMEDQSIVIKKEQHVLLGNQASKDGTHQEAFNAVLEFQFQSPVTGEPPAPMDMSLSLADVDEQRKAMVVVPTRIEESRKEHGECSSNPRIQKRRRPRKIKT